MVHFGHACRNQINPGVNNNHFIFDLNKNNNSIFGLNASTLVNADTVRPVGGEKTLRSSRLPPPNHLLNTLSQLCSTESAY